MKNTVNLQQQKLYRVIKRFCFLFYPFDLQQQKLYRVIKLQNGEKIDVESTIVEIIQGY